MNIIYVFNIIFNSTTLYCSVFFCSPQMCFVYIVDAAKTMVFGGFLEIFGKTIGQINFKLDVYQGSRVLKTIVSIEIDFS